MVSGLRVDWLITELDVLGGAETFVRQMAPMLHAAGITVRVVTLRRGGYYVDGLLDAGITVIQCDLASLSPYNAYAKINALWKAHQPEIVHTHLYHAGIFGRILAHFHKIPGVIVHQHGPEMNRSSFRTWLDASTASWVTRYVVSSSAVQEILHQREKIPATKISVIRNGVFSLKNHYSVDPAPPSILPGLPAGETVIGCVGRLSPEKGHAVLLEAVGLLKQAGVFPQVVLVGGGECQVSLEVLSRKVGIEPQIHFVGPQHNVSDWLKLFDIFVLPSDWEGISLSLIEAMQAGLPVIATATGGTPEVIQHRLNGLLIPPRDPQSLKNALSEMMTSQELARNLGNQAKLRVETEFSAEQTVSHLTALYDQVLSR